MEWKTIKASQIPSRKCTNERKVWKPDAEDVTAVFTMLLTGEEAIMMKMPDSDSARKKSEAMLKWIKSQPTIPATLTCFVRDNNVIIVDINLTSERRDG